MGTRLTLEEIRTLLADATAAPARRRAALSMLDRHPEERLARYTRAKVALETDYRREVSGLDEQATAARAELRAEHRKAVDALRASLREALQEIDSATAQARAEPLARMRARSSAVAADYRAGRFLPGDPATEAIRAELAATRSEPT